MSRAGGPLRELLYFLLRLILFALTGQWPRAEEESSPRSRRPAALPPTFRPAPDRDALREKLELARAQRPSHTHARLDWLERLGRELRAPFEAHARAQGVGLRRRKVVVVTDADAQFLHDVAAHTPIWPVSLAQEELASLRSEARTARSVARSWVADMPGWLSQLRRAYRLPKGLVLPSRTGYDPESLAGLFGPWLPAILGEATTTAQLGPAYTWDLLRELSSAGSFRAVQASPASGAPHLLSEEPPLLVNVLSSLHTLEALGFVREAEALRRAFAGALGGAPALSLPLAGGGHEEVAWEVWSDELELFLNELLFSPQPVLHGARLLDIPHLGYGAAEHARVQQLAAALARGEQASAPARLLVAAALLALADGGVSEAELARTLERSMGDRLPRRGARAAASVPATPKASPTSWGTAFKDPQLVREAVALGAAVGPRKGLLAPRRSRPRA